jgi:hypothetical protein
MSESHEQAADRMEREADDMQHHSEQVGEDIADAREEWEAKKRDDKVPGAGTQNPEGGLPPEANYTTSGDRPPEGDGGGGMPPPEPDETD